MHKLRVGSVADILKNLTKEKHDIHALPVCFSEIEENNAPSIENLTKSLVFIKIISTAFSTYISNIPRYSGTIGNTFKFLDNLNTVLQVPLQNISEIAKDLNNSQTRTHIHNYIKNSYKIFTTFIQQNANSKQELDSFAAHLSIIINELNAAEVYNVKSLLECLSKPLENLTGTNHLGSNKPTDPSTTSNDDIIPNIEHFENSQNLKLIQFAGMSGQFGMKVKFLDKQAAKEYNIEREKFATQKKQYSTIKATTEQMKMAVPPETKEIYKKALTSFETTFYDYQSMTYYDNVTQNYLKSIVNNFIKNNSNSTKLPLEADLNDLIEYGKLFVEKQQDISPKETNVYLQQKSRRPTIIGQRHVPPEVLEIKKPSVSFDKTIAAELLTHYPTCYAYYVIYGDLPVDGKTLQKFWNEKDAKINELEKKTESSDLDVQMQAHGKLQLKPNKIFQQSKQRANDIKIDYPQYKTENFAKELDLARAIVANNTAETKKTEETIESQKSQIGMGSQHH